MPFDPMLLITFVLLIVMVFMMMRGNKKRAQMQAELQAKRVVGADVLTQAGIFGTIRDIDEENNVTTLETTPGTLIRVHTLTIASVIDPQPVADTTPTTADSAVSPARDTTGIGDDRDDLGGSHRL